MNYNLFLFNELLRLFNNELYEQEYDRLFDDVNELFNDYNNSNFSLQFKSEYECIIDYLNDKYRKP